MKKGQAAMEFLMTYGWAILAAIIVIGVLAYFGVFSPSRYVPSACMINAPFGCEEYTVTTTGVTLVLRNGYGDSVTVNNVSVENCGSYATPTDIADGDTATVTVSCTLTSGDRFKGDVTVTYVKSGGVLNQTATGSVRGTVA
jgi:hypothetical protein